MDIVFDFDGVLCQYKGWRGHDNIGEPINEMIDLVFDLHNEGHTLKLSTTRLNPYPFGNDQPDQDVLLGNAEANIRKWLDQFGIESCFKEITGYKPFGDIYIDDKAVLFEEYGNEVYNFDHTQIVYGLDACSIHNLIIDKSKGVKSGGGDSSHA